MTFAVLWFAVAGVLLGGAFAFARQRKPAWSVVVLVLLAAGTAWFGWVNVQAVS